MDKTRYFEKELPDSYVLKEHVDAKKDKKIIVIYTLLSLVPLFIVVPLMYRIATRCSGYSFGEFQLTDCFVLLGLSLLMLVYIVLHELTHGITYKAFTGGKLTFGLTLVVAYCGVPDLYVRKKASIAALVMPFFVFTVIFGVLTAVLYAISPLYGVMASVLLAIHLGGCVGDLHWTLMYLTKYRHCETLMRDTGPEQWLYVYDKPTHVS